MLTLRMPWTNQALDKHVGDSTDSDNEEKEDGELEEGEVEEEIDENPQQKDDAKENNRESNSNADSINDQDPNNDPNAQSNLASQKFRRRDYHHSQQGQGQQQQQQQQQSRLNNLAGQQDKRNKNEPRRKRRHSGEDREDRNRKLYKRGRFRGGAYPDLTEEAEDDDMMGSTWSTRGTNRGQRKNPSDNPSNENSEPNQSMDSSSTSNNTTTDSKNEQSINGDDASGPSNDIADDEMGNADEKQDRNSRTKVSKTNPTSNSMSIENRGRRYYEGNNNSNTNRRSNDRDRSSWQDRSGGNSGNNNSNNSRFRSDMNSNGPPLCKFFMEKRCAKGNDCQFSHDYKPPKRTEVCKFYVQNKGFCQKNDNCPYLHREFPCKFYHTRSNCSQGDRCIFSHDPITNEDIRMAFERYVNDSDEMNRQNRNNANSNLHHNNNPSSVNFDVMPGSSLLPPPAPPSMPASLTDPNNFPMINFMDMLLRQNGQLPNPALIDSINAGTTEKNANSSQSSPPMQRNNVYNDTLITEKSDIDDSNNNKNVSSMNSTSPTQSSSSSSSATLPTTTSSNDNNNSTSLTTTSANTSTMNTATTTTNNNPSACPLPLPPQINNTNITLPSPFGRLPTPNVVRSAATLLPPPPPPGLFQLSGLQAPRVPLLFPSNSTLPLPLPPTSLLEMEIITKAAIAAANAAAANNFNTPNTQPLSPQLGRDIDERDRQPSNMMTGDIDERPSDAFNRPTNSVPNMGLFQPSNNLSTTTPTPTNTSSSTIPVTVNDDPMKNKTVQDLFRTTKPTVNETIPSTTPTNNSAGPSFDFISMLEQLKQQPKATQSTDDSLEIRSSATSTSVYILRPVHVAFKPYSLPHRSMSADPRIPKYEEKMREWSERNRFEQYKNSSFLSINNNYPQPTTIQSQASLQSAPMIDNSLSRDPRLLRNTVSTNKIGIPILPTPTPPFV